MKSLKVVILMLLLAGCGPGQSSENVKLSKATFAGGCFWCIEAPFEKVRGVHSAVSSLTGTVKKNVDPLPGSDSTQMRPPWRSTIFLHTARPMPVPSYSSRLCRRLKIIKMRSKCSGAMPMPLSRTKNVHSPPLCSALT